MNIGFFSQTAIANLSSSEVSKGTPGDIPKTEQALPIRYLAHPYMYIHTRPFIGSETEELSYALNSNVKGPRFTDQERKEYTKFDTRAISDSAREEFDNWSTIAPPENAFLIAGHGTPRHILRWPSVILVAPDDSENARKKGYYSPAQLYDYLAENPAMHSKRVFLMQKAEYIIILACNTGNDIDPIPGNRPCFAQEFSTLIGKPCLAPQGFLIYGANFEPETWSKTKPAGFSSLGDGVKRSFKMFYPSPAYEPRIQPPSKINCAFDRMKK